MPKKASLPLHNAFILALLGFLTLELYTFYWLCDTAQYLRRAGHRIPPSWQLLPGALSIVILHFIPVKLYFAWPEIVRAQQPSTYSFRLQLFVAIMALTGLVLVLRWMWFYCKASARATGDNQIRSYVFFVACTLIGAPFIWAGFTQAAYNRAK